MLNESFFNAASTPDRVFEQKLNRSRKSLRRDVGRAIADFNMIEDGDLVMVCLSGGKL